MEYEKEKNPYPLGISFVIEAEDGKILYHCRADENLDDVLNKAYRLVEDGHPFRKLRILSVKVGVFTEVIKEKNNHQK